MDVKDLKKLLESVADSEVSELILETGDYKLTVKRGQQGAVIHQQEARPQSQAKTEAAQVPQKTESPAASNPPAEASQEDKSHLNDVTAPIVGTFYAAPSPDEDDYVKVGDKVSAGSVLCIIEAMKLMNEIEAESSGTIAEILVKNEEPVEFGQVLFRIDPS